MKTFLIIGYIACIIISLIIFTFLDRKDGCSLEYAYEGENLFCNFVMSLFWPLFDSLGIFFFIWEKFIKVLLIAIVELLIVCFVEKQKEE